MTVRWEAKLTSSSTILRQCDVLAARAAVLSRRYVLDSMHALPRIADALCLGAPHKCICGVDVDSSGIHGLSCRKSAGRHVRHSALNDLVKRALTSAEVPSRLEPSSLSRV